MVVEPPSISSEIPELLLASESIMWALHVCVYGLKVECEQGEVLCSIFIIPYIARSKQWTDEEKGTMNNVI